MIWLSWFSPTGPQPTDASRVLTALEKNFTEKDCFSLDTLAHLSGVNKRNLPKILYRLKEHGVVAHDRQNTWRKTRKIHWMAHRDGE